MIVKMSIVNIDDFLSTRRILHNETPLEFNDALMYFMQNREIADIITYQNESQFVLNNINILEKDRNLNLFYQFSVKREADIVDSIRFESTSNLNVELSYYIGGIKYMPEKFSEFVTIASAYNDFQIRVTFLESPSVDAEFKIVARYYLINSDDRNILVRNKVVTKNIIYFEGVCKTTS